MVPTMSHLSTSKLRDRAVSRLLPNVGLVLSIVGAIVIAALVGGAVGMIAGWRPSNPFGERNVDRTGPSVLHSLTDLSEYHAASGYYETVVDLEGEASRLPDWLKGERVLYVGKGDVDAVVDFGQLDEGSVKVSEDRTSVTVRLPAPTIDKPQLDLATSYVVEHDQGIVNRFKGSDVERRAQLKAVEQMTAAANGEDQLVDRAKANTSSMLRGLFGSLGFTSITITFDEDAG
jgi:hypothetical protein